MRIGIVTALVLLGSFEAAIAQGTHANGAFEIAVTTTSGLTIRPLNLSGICRSDQYERVVVADGSPVEDGMVLTIVS